MQERPADKTVEKAISKKKGLPPVPTITTFPSDNANKPSALKRYGSLRQPRKKPVLRKAPWWSALSTPGKGVATEHLSFSWIKDKYTKSTL